MESHENEPIAFDVVLPPSLFEYDDLVKRTLTLLIYDGEIVQAREVIDVAKNVALLPGFEADSGNRIELVLVESGLENRTDFNEFGHRRAGQIEVAKENGKASCVLTPQLWCPAGQLGVRTTDSPSPNVESFQDEEAMRRLE